MTNKEAIEVLQSMKSDFPLPKAAQTRRAQNDALDAAIKALKAEPRDDTISRQAALNPPVTMVSDGLDWIPAYHIKGLPSAQPEQMWIPCSKRLPEEHEWIGTKKFGTTISDEVYVTFENEKGERFCQHMKFQNGELSRYAQFYVDAWFKGSKPIAWMPLPEPYKEEQK